MARKMKDSGIEWIGEIPEGWEVAPLKRFASIQTGNTPTKTSDSNYYASTGIPWIKPDNLGYSHSISKTSEYLTSEGALCARIMPPNTVYVCCIGSLGKVGYSSISCACNQQINALIFNDLMFWKYGYYLTIAQESQYLLFGNGNVLQIINSTSQGNIACVLPPLENQHLIACYLDSVYSDIEVLIAKARSSIEEYKKLKQAVITQAVTKGVRGEREMKDSGVEWIGEINHRFSLIKLKYICSILDQYRKPISADKRSQSGSVLYDYYGASGAIDKIDDYTIDDHVMLIGEDGANLRMRNLPLMYEVNGKAWINNHAHILKPTERVDFYYLFYALEELDINPYITGSAQPKLSQEKLQNIWVPLPDLEEQQEIATYIRSKCAEIDKLIAKKEQLIKELESYKKSLIYEVVTGKREV